MYFSCTGRIYYINEIKNTVGHFVSFNFMHDISKMQAFGYLKSIQKLICLILLSIMHIPVQCAPEFYNNFCQKKWILCFKNNFTRINHCKFIHHTSLILNPFSASMYSAQEIFQHHFPCKKVRTILDKILFSQQA